VSAVPAPSLFAVGTVIEHPWVAAAHIGARMLPGATNETTVRIVPSAAGLDALRAHGKAAFVAALNRAQTGLPPDVRAWRLVSDLHDPTEDADDSSNRARLRLVRRHAGDSLEATLFVPFDLRVFEGHFEGIPIVPGIVQVAWALAVAHDHLPHAGTFRGINAVKFRRLVRPGMELQLAMQWSAATRELRFEFRHEAVTMAIGRLCMTVAA
jgi:hypothetical protein